MKGFIIVHIFILVLAVARNGSCSIAASRGRADLELHKWVVHVVNGLSNGKTLLVHCKSKDDDLGPHYLQTGQEVNWSFRENFFETTLFWCHWSKDNVHANFDVFWDSEHLFYRCGYKHCFWVAKEDGLYLKNLTDKYDELWHKWEPGK